jgi:hypothetical protein
MAATACRISNSGEFVHAAPWSVAQQGSMVLCSREKGDVVVNTNTGGPELKPYDGFGV